MARTARHVTVIRFANGRDLIVQPSPDAVATSVKQSDGGLMRILDLNGNPAWINPRDITSISSHRARKRRTAASQENRTEQLEAELAALGEPSPGRPAAG
jgi:uncharacterized protein YlzI (FlbEa/FlbD family)